MIKSLSSLLMKQAVSTRVEEKQVASPSSRSYQRRHKVGNGYDQNALHEVIRVNKHIKIPKRKKYRKKLEIVKVKTLL